jgi:hypothetical protein
MLRSALGGAELLPFELGVKILARDFWPLHRVEALSTFRRVTSIKFRPYKAIALSSNR